MPTLGVDDGTDDLRLEVLGRATAAVPTPGEPANPLTAPLETEQANTARTFTRTTTTPTMTANRTTVWGDGNIVTGAGAITTGAGAVTTGAGALTSGANPVDLSGTVTVPATADISVTAGETVVVGTKTDTFDIHTGPEGTPLDGTWTSGTNGGVLESVRTAAAVADEILLFRISQLGRTAATKGMKINSVDFVYSIATDVMTAMALSLFTVTLNGDGSVPTAAVPAVTVTPDLTVAEHTINMAVDVPVFVATDTYSWVEIKVEGTATGVLAVKAVKVNYSLALD